MKNTITQTKYNGWTNYATWRVNLEMIDERQDHYFEEIKSMIGEKKTINTLNLTRWLSDLLREDVEEFLSCEIVRETLESTYSDNNLCLDYAIAFISECNFWEIAEHMLIDYGTTTNLNKLINV